MNTFLTDCELLGLDSKHNKASLIDFSQDLKIQG